MMRLIDADLLKLKYCEGCASCGMANPPCEILSLIDDQPTVDPVKHGHWVQRFTGDESIVFCSNCSEEANEMLDYKLLYEYDFCPYCGAKMDEEV